MSSFKLQLRSLDDKIDAFASTEANMLIPIASADQLGRLVRATRRAQQLRLDDTAGAVGVGHVFVRDVEHGKPTVQLGRVLQLLAELGIELKAEVSDAAFTEYNRLQSTGMKPLKTRRR
jgi:ribosome-binding protein aMBF1 (putative translation factor)